MVLAWTGAVLAAATLGAAFCGVLGAYLAVGRSARRSSRIVLSAGRTAVDMLDAGGCWPTLFEDLAWSMFRTGSTLRALASLH